MSKELILVRHAKSSWDDTSLSDFERPLNKRGLKNAPDMGKRLDDKEYSPELIITSPALRAISTAKIIAQEINYPEKKIKEEPAIYDASLNALLNLLASFDDDVSSIMMVGHNPGFTYLCDFLSNAGIDNLPTCSISLLQLNVEKWSSIHEHCGKLIDHDYPKKHQ